MAKRCCFCETTSLDELLGPFYTLSEYNFHSNCLVFSSDIRQNPDRTKGLNGFETKTIETALYWGQTRTCTVCSKKGATINCVGGGDENSLPCKATYHLPCALKSKTTLHVYHQKFETYCYEHIQNECFHEYEKITGIHFVTDCCKKICGHEKCIETHVKKSKSLAKCLKCNNDTEFKTFVQTKLSLTISNEIPSYGKQQDLAFDLKCEAEHCDCKGGRSGHREQPLDKYHLIECFYCGSNAIHRVCGQLGRKKKPIWRCSVCTLGSDLPPEAEQQSKKRKRAPESMGTNKKTVGNKCTASASSTATAKKLSPTHSRHCQTGPKNIKRGRRGDLNTKL